MDDTIYINGRAYERHRHFGRPYLRQLVRTDGARALYVAEHLELLNNYAPQFFGERITVTAQQIVREVDAMLRAERYSLLKSHIIELRIYGASQFSLHVVETSLYDRFGLRAIRPVARIVEESIPLNGAPTGAFAEFVAILRRRVNIAEGGEPIRNTVPVTVERDGCISSIDGATPIAVKGRQIIFAPHVESVEVQRIKEVCARLRRSEVVVREILCEELASLDELMYVDARGITSIIECEGAVYADIIANVLDRAME